MNKILTAIVVLILVYGLVSSIYYIKDNGFTAATGFFVAPNDGMAPGVSYFKVSGVAIDRPSKCKDICYAGDTACSNKKEITCSDQDGDGCTEWSQPYSCLGNEFCGNSACGDLTRDVPLINELHKFGISKKGITALQSRCINECNPGDRVGWSEGFYKVCDTNYDNDPCYEFSFPYQCPSGTYSRAGKCIKERGFEEGQGYGK